MHHRERARKIRNVTVLGMLVNVFLTVIKLVSGLLIRSTALIADGIHSISDLATDFIVLISSRISSRPADDTHPYGHKKFETLATQVISAILIYVSINLIWSAVRSIFQGEKNFPGMVVLIVAMVSVVFKEAMFRVTRRVSRETNSPALHANAWHNRSDAFSSVAVLLGGAAGLMGWGYADHVATIVVGLMIIVIGVKIFFEGLIELTDHAGDKRSVQTIKHVLADQGDISGWHALRTRKVGGEMFVDVHIIVNPDLTVGQSHEISNRIEAEIKSRLSLPVNILIHIDPDDVHHRG